MFMEWDCLVMEAYLQPKPYICGSSYFMKMMDFKKGEWCNTMDGLYWRFIDRNRKFFLTNPRLSMMVRIFDKMKD
jgi:deoxyribodipyrimidine photolyase-related protein